MRKANPQAEHSRKDITMATKVTVWNEYLHELEMPEVAAIYPKGIHGCIADFLKEAGMDVKTATLREPVVLILYTARPSPIKND